MKFSTVLALVVASLLLASMFSSQISGQDGRKPQDVVVLGTEAKLGTVKFSHIDHITKNRSIEVQKSRALSVIILRNRLLKLLSILR